jgi:hypothetical protein
LIFYENSFFWYLKRNYLLNSLNSNLTENLLNFKKINLNVKIITNDARFGLVSLLNLMINSPTSNLHAFHVSRETSLINFFTSINGPTRLNSFQYKDLEMNFTNRDLLNMDNLEKFLWISTAGSSSSGGTIFFNYLNFYKNLNNVRFFFFKPKIFEFRFSMNPLLFLLFNYDDRLFIDFRHNIYFFDELCNTKF